VGHRHRRARRRAADRPHQLCVPAALEQNPAGAPVKSAADTLTLARQSAVIAHTTARTIRTGIENGAPAKVLISADQAALYDPDAQGA
jgi:hypothetical protein